MIIDYEGQRYEFEFDDITVKQAMKLEKHTGMKLTDWSTALESGNHFPALQALGWLVLAGGQGAVDDTDFKVVKFGQAFGAAIAAAAAEKAAREAAAPVPTAAVPASNGHKSGVAAQHLSLQPSAQASP